MSAATIAEPFLLVSYPESSAHRKRKLIPTYVSIASGSDADAFVSVAVQGDGLHVLDTSTLHPAVSHTLGPSTSFSCPPATRVSQTEESPLCTTYAVLDSGPDVQHEGKGKTIVSYEEPLSAGMSSGIQSEKKKRVAVVPYAVAHIYAPDYLQDHILLIGAAGDISLADEELHVLQTSAPQNSRPSVLLKHFIFPASSCSFLQPSTSSPFDAASVSFLRSGDVLRLGVVGVSLAGDKHVHLLGECAIPTEETDIVDISLSSAGFMSILLSSGTWLAFTLATSPTSATLTITQVGEPVRLQNLTFVNTSRAPEASLAALTSSHVLLTAVTAGSLAEIILLLWDLRYGVLLAQQTLTVPSTLPRPKKYGAVLRLDVPQRNPGASKSSAENLNAILTLLPLPERDMQADTGSSPARSTVLVVPVSVPATSTIAAAMGKANAGARWIASKTAHGNQSHPQGTRSAPEMSAAARKVLSQMKAAIDGSANGSTSSAESIFFDYVNQQNKGKGAAEEAESVPTEYSFVQGVLELVLHAPASAQGKSQNANSYSQKIVSHLLEARFVSSSMVEGGLLPALVVRKDWNAVSLAMRTVTDLPEDDVMSVLKQVVASHRLSSSSGDESAMQVDSAPAVETGATPSLPTFLAQCVSYPFTPALQRTAIRKHLPDAADLTAVLDVLDKWVVEHTEADLLLSTAESSSHEVVVETPSLEKTLSFLQTVLDASFLALLAHAPAHQLLQNLAGHIEPAIACASQLETLCGPLEPFARAAAVKAKVQAEAKEGGRADSGKDWRRKRKIAHEQAGMAVGLYQVEELVL